MSLLLRALLPLILALPACASTPARESHPGAEDFIESLVREHGLEKGQVRDALADAKFQQSIIDAMTRPAEAKPWSAYRPIFMTDARIEGGVRFWSEHRELIDKVSAETGVPAEIIVAIIGVETNFGRITGSYRVVDALATLGFHYPPRAEFFRGELAQLFLLLRDEPQLQLADLKGSYAGAMGWGQFIPTSYRKFAVDGDGDGRRDLWTSLPDIVASIANYFVVHGWQPGGTVAVRANVQDNARDLGKTGLEPVYPVSQLAEWGYVADPDLDPDLPANLVVLEGADGPEHWIVLQNFYTISRYNRSPLYSMAVWQLSQAIAERIRTQG